MVIPILSTDTMVNRVDVNDKFLSEDVVRRTEQAGLGNMWRFVLIPEETSRAKKRRVFGVVLMIFS